MKLIKSDLYNTNNFINNTNLVISNNEKILLSINNFISTSAKTLKGNGYDSIRNKMNIYCDALIKQNKLFNILLNNIICANDYLINYMQEYDELDDSKINELQTRISNIDKCIIDIKNNIYNLDNEVDKDLINILNNNLKKYENGNVTNKRIFDKLNNLQSADSKASSYINDVIDDINRYKNAIDNINTTII